MVRWGGDSLGGSSWGSMQWVHRVPHSQQAVGVHVAPEVQGDRAESAACEVYVGSQPM